MHTRTKAALPPLVFLFLLSPGQSGASQTGPANYDQCIQAAKKATASNRNTDEAARSCHKKFSGKRPQDENLPPEVLGKLDTDGGFGYGIFGGSIYNGNSDYTITQVTLLLTPLPAELALAAKEYNIDVTLQPLSKGELSAALTSDVTREFSWRLIRARGYKTR